MSLNPPDFRRSESPAALASPRSLLRSLATALGLALAVLLPCRASAVVVAGDTFTGYTPGQFDNQTALGTNLTGKWSAVQVTMTQFISAGLSFSTMTTSGGAVRISDVGGVGPVIDQTEVVLGAGAGAVNGDLWMRLLVKPETAGAKLNTLLKPIANLAVAVNASTGTDDSSLSLGGSTISSSYAQLVAGQTYMLLVHFTNIGLATPVVGSMSVLSEAQYADWLAQGGTEAQLLARNAGVSAADRWAAIEADSTNPIAFGSGSQVVLQSVAPPFVTGTMTFDELIFTTTLAEAAQTPEPATAALMMAGALACLRRKRQRIAAK